MNGAAIVGPAPRIRGQALALGMAVADELHGPAFVADLVEALPAGAKRVLAPSVVPTAWYDERLQVDLVAAAHQRVGDEGLFAMGLAVGLQQITRWHRFVLRVPSPPMLWPRLVGMWRYWHDTGRMSVVAFGESAIEAVMRDHRFVASPGYAAAYLGYAGAVLTLVGCEDVRLGVGAPDEASISAWAAWGPAHAAEPKACGKAFRVTSALGDLPTHYRATIMRERRLA